MSSLGPWCVQIAQDNRVASSQLLSSSSDAEQRDCDTSLLFFPNLHLSNFGPHGPHAVASQAGCGGAVGYAASANR